MLCESLLEFLTTLLKGCVWNLCCHGLGGGPGKIISLFVLFGGVAGRVAVSMRELN